MRRFILIVALPLLMGTHARQSVAASGEPAPLPPCGSICDELAGAWSVTVAPPTSVMVTCADPKADRTAVTFPSEAIGLGEVKVAPSRSGPLIELRSAGSSVRIVGSLDPGTMGLRFELQDRRGKALRCSGILRKFTNPSGSEGWVGQTTCESGTAGSAVCRLEPSVKVTLLVQRILMEGAPSR